MAGEESPQAAHGGLDRRALLRGTVWAVPIIAVSAAAPSAAAMTGEPIFCQANVIPYQQYFEFTVLNSDPTQDLYVLGGNATGGGFGWEVYNYVDNGSDFLIGPGATGTVNLLTYPPTGGMSGPASIDVTLYVSLTGALVDATTITQTFSITVPPPFECLPFTVVRGEDWYLGQID